MTMDQKVKIAGLQMNPKILDKERNLARCLDLVKVTAMEGARLVVFPECALTGYCFSSLEDSLPLAEQIPGPSTDRLIEACRELKTASLVWCTVGVTVESSALPTASRQEMEASQDICETNPIAFRIWHMAYQDRRALTLHRFNRNTNIYNVFSFRMFLWIIEI